MRLIDADALFIDASFFNDELDRAERFYSEEQIKNAPTVEEIVRCKDCKFFNLAKNGWNGSCDLRIDAFNGFYANDFCSFGEKNETDRRRRTT